MNAPQFFGAMFGPLRRLTDFSGRSTRGEFWPFVFLLYAVQQIGTWVAINPFMSKFQRFSEADRDGLLADAERAKMLRAFFALFDDIMLISIGSMAISLLLLAAATTRRLHDTDRTGWWAAPLIVLGAVGIWLLNGVTKVFSGFGRAPETVTWDGFLASFLPLMANNIIYLALFVTIIIFCAQDGTIGPNRFGEDPKDRDPAEEAERRARIAEPRLRREAGARDPAKRAPPARISTDPPVPDERPDHA